MKKKVVLGLSGGVDSSVTAVLLQQQGYEVIGITFQFIDDFDDTDAKKVAKKLGIEHHTLDYRKEFKQLIMDNFISDYQSGITPNPCVECNKKAKVKFLYEEMLKHNADYISTGHYAKIVDGKLYKSVDQNKDQTYFLSEVPGYILERIILPLEGMEKSEVREIAANANLENASKKDSTDVCFITTKFKEYMSKEIKTKQGNIINVENGEILGKHQGLSLYTIGQRKGLNIGGTADKTFVVGKDTTKNVLYVGLGNKNEYLMSDATLVTKMNWIGEPLNGQPLHCFAKFRYRQQEAPVTIQFIDEDRVMVGFDEPLKAITPGQAAAFYLGDQCLGGGMITTVYKNGKPLEYLKML